MYVWYEVDVMLLMAYIYLPTMVTARITNNTPLLCVRHSLSTYINGMSVLPLLTVYIQYLQPVPETGQADLGGSAVQPLQGHRQARGGPPLRPLRLRHLRPCGTELCQLTAVGQSCVS